jgi:hypothetical protein
MASRLSSVDGQARRAAALKKFTRASAVTAALLGILIYAGVSGLPAGVQAWLAADVQPQVTTDAGASSDDNAPAPPAQAPGSYAGGPVQTRTGAS